MFLFTLHTHHVAKSLPPPSSSLQLLLFCLLCVCLFSTSLSDAVTQDTQVFTIITIFDPVSTLGHVSHSRVHLVLLDCAYLAFLDNLHYQACYQQAHFQLLSL